MTNRSPIQDARTLRQRQTKAEALACVQARLSVELDGEYHETQLPKDVAREAFLKSKGWAIIRFSNEEVLADPESVANAIARRLGLRYEFRQRRGGSSSVATRQRIELEKRNRSSK
ncbi:endonuclease domain-containing protein [Neorhodopirellula pilleata]|uniref:endonuclease domain-containing protein n=1 Tax=Neorhodopirellula pilleata TaxID=2714738 RepID=UPI0011B85EF5|nr:DUF559 domain-containing protein [Neorhodopirellula pilleata]